MGRLVLRLVAVAVLAVAPLAACGAPAGHGGKPVVVTSTDVWASVASAVAGDHAQVRAIIDNPAEDPHSYDASPADAAALADAQLVVYNGGDYDRFVDAVLDEHGDVRRVDAFSAGGHAAHSNPHVFYDLGTVSTVADAVAEQLAALDAAHAADYRSHAQKFTAQIRDLTAAERRVASAHPGAWSVATEDIAQYLEAATGLTDKTPAGYYKAVEADTEPAPADMATMLDLVNSHRVQVVLFNPQTDTPAVHRIVDAANSAGVPVVDVRETLPTGMDFVTWQRQTVEKLGAALQKADNHP